MKQACQVLKIPILLLLLFAGTSGLSAQNCYQIFLEEGIRAFNSFQFETAINKFQAAKVCVDRPESTEPEEWLTKAQNGYIDRLQLIASRYLTSEGQRAFQNQNYRIAFRLYQEALNYKSDNTQARMLQEQMLSYMADYQYDIKIDSRFYKPNQVVLDNNSYLVDFNKNEATGKTQIDLIDSNSRDIKQSFLLKGVSSNYQFSKDGKWLAVEFYNVKKQKVNLALWEVASGQLIDTFDHIYRSDFYKAFTFSDNGEKMVYRTEETIEIVSFVINEEKSFNDTLRAPGYSLNVYDLISRKSIYSTAACRDYFSNSNEGLIAFPGLSVRQNLINEKISLKFGTDGVITTNNENFVLKENEFRIRNDYDFAISPDGKKLAFHEYGEEKFTEINFNTDVQINFGPEPKILVGTIKVINLEDSSLVFSAKSEYAELLQRFLPFSFSKNSKHLVFVDSRKWQGINFNKETIKLESSGDIYRIGFNIYNFEKKEFDIKDEPNIYDFFVTDNNLLITWEEDKVFAGSSGKLNVYDLNADTLLFSKYNNDDFSHFFDIKAEKDQVYFSTFNTENLKTIHHVLDIKSDSITTINYDFVTFDYTYVRNSSDRTKMAFLTDNGTSISVWNLKSQQKIREIKCQFQIAEFDFSSDAKFLIIRDKNNLLKVVDLEITENLYDYFDNYLNDLTAEEKEQIGIDW